MRSKFRHSTFLVILAVLFQICEGVRENIFENSVVDFEKVFSAAELFVPTIYSENDRCRNHSLLYLEQLKELKLWATEMFDASTKFPSGLLYGSTYNTGNFDECLEVKVPYNHEEFKGKYCMARFKLNPTEHIPVQKKVDWETDDYKTYFNLSVTQKLWAYANTLSRTRRNDYHLAFCLPSSCSHSDLKYSLNSIVTRQRFESFKIDIEIKKENCQTEDDQYKFTTGDIIFGAVLTFYLMLVLVASIWYKMVIIINLDQKGKLFKFAKCLALAANTRKIMNVKTRNPDGLDSIAGMKVASMFLIILGHRCIFIFGSPLQNPKFLEQLYLKAEAAVLLNGTIIVDTFFIIAGFLAAYMLLDKFKTNISLKNIPWIYFHRILRILPSYAVVLAFYSTVFSKIGSGPFWQQRVGIEQERCSQNWWANLLFVNNYVNVDNICMFQSWYLDCDMHYFLIAPFLIYLLQRKYKLGLSTVGGLIAASLITSFAIVYVNNYDAILLAYTGLLRDPTLNQNFQNIYIPSHMRASPYLLGILFGFIKYKMKINGYKIPTHIVYCGWIISVFMMITTWYSGYIFYVPNGFKNRVFTAFYSGMHHFTWSVCIGWMIIAVTEGHGGIITPFLAWKPIMFLSRITYSAFLVHGAIQIYSVATIRSPIYASIFNTVYLALGDVFCSYVFGFFLNIFFESPVVQLEKCLFGKKQESRPLQNLSSQKHTEANISRETVITILPKTDVS